MVMKNFRSQNRTLASEAEVEHYQLAGQLEELSDLSVASGKFPFYFINTSKNLKKNELSEGQWKNLVNLEKKNDFIENKPK